MGPQNKTALAAILFLCALVSLSCSSGKKTPLLPDETGSEIITLSDAVLDAGRESMFGAFEIILNAQNLTLDKYPLRRAFDIGDSYNLQIDQYLQSDPCSDCLKISNLGIDDDGNIIMDIGIRHPFDASSPRLDLDVFDVRAIIVAGGDQEFPLTLIDGESAKGNFNFVLNADGYTSQFDDGPDGPYVGNINPYIDFFVEDDPSWDGIGEKIPNHRMAVGDDYDYKRLILNIPPGNSLPFRLVISASYGISAKKNITAGQPGSRLNPTYYLPEFNRKEAYSVQMDHSIEFGENANLRLELEVLDWQAGAHVASSYPSNLGDLEASSGIKNASVEIPELNAYITVPDLITGEGVIESPWKVQFTVPMSQFSVYTVLSRVVDERDTIIDDMDISSYQYGEIDTFIKINANKKLGSIRSTQHNVVLGHRSIAVDQNKVYVVWADVDGVRGVVRCAKSSDGGNTFLSPVKVSDHNYEDFKQRPAIAVDDRGSVYIVWEDYGNLNPFSDAPDIIMSKSNNYAYSFGQNIRVNDEDLVADDFQTEPTICSAPDGHVFVSWLERPSGATARHVRLARSSNGGQSFTETKVSSDQLRAGNPSMDVNDSGVIWIAWRDYRRDNQDIYASQSSNYGQSFGPEILVNDDDGYSFQSEPAVAVGDDGTAFIAWLDGRDGGYNIYFAKSLGTSAFRANQRINRIPSVAINPNIVASGNGGVFVVYRDMRSDVLGDIFVTASLDAGQTFTLHHDVKINDDNGSNIQICPQVTLGNDGKLHFAWGDGRNGSADIFYAQSIFP